jgi:hypothetical protein
MKHAKYDALAAQRNASLVPFAIETFGAFGKEAQDFVRKLASHAATAGSSWTSTELRYGLVSSLQIAVQRGNAYLLDQGLQEARTHGLATQS